MTRASMNAFLAEYGKEIESFFASQQKVATWGAASFDNVTIGYKTGHCVKRVNGRLIRKSDSICRFESLDGSVILNGSVEIKDELLVAQIKGLLEDNEQASRYCEQVSSTLLEDGECVFNAPYGLHMKDKEYEERYYSEKWQNAWISALSSVFQAKDITADENAGIGCYRLRAI